ncbi:hypothetical protein [Rhodovulum steppense]|uniref:DUF2946 family protein n=1 Tax=Rhodovulum steppense TaxID=540251 RepID=A0A4R1YU36_9RHOB|nr:hypothetical protein [Rhodovulum steppense]TCM84602.1 hypothetical protein EV216_11184 [Rhodovulum steppense]
MRQIRPLLALGLALGLVLASLGLASARGQPGPVGTLVICTGMGLQAIAVDAQGNPVGPPHICPDGLAALAALMLPALAPPARPLQPGATRLPLVAAMAEGRDSPQPRSRGPPAAVA